METKLIFDKFDQNNINTEVTTTEKHVQKRIIKLVAYRLKNFKAFEDTGWIKLGKLVMIYGENSAGKTAIHQPLLYLKTAYDSERKHQSIYSITQLDESKADLSDLINKSNYQEGMSILFKFSSLEQEEYVYELNFLNHFGVEVESALLLFNDVKINLSEYYDIYNIFFLKERVEETDPRITSIVIGIMDELKRFSNIFAFLSPIRKLPEREFLFHHYDSDDLGRNGENTYIKLYNLLDDKKYENTMLSRWVHDFGFRLEWKQLGPNRGKFVLVDYESGIESNLIDNGFGIGQSLPVMTAMTVSDNNALVIDSPEAFLQTNMQTKLADYIMECAYKNQLLMIETGSEYILQRIRRRIAEQKFATEDFVVVFVYEKEGTATCKEITFDKRGNMIHSIKEFEQFFSSAYEDTMATLLINAGVKNEQ